MSLNPGKCVVIQFGRVGGFLSDRRDSPYRLSGEYIQLVKCHRDLGVIVDEKLRFHEHVDSVVRKARGLMGCLLRATKCRDQNFMLSLFISHIRPLIDYCSSVWNVGFLGDSRRLESLQRRWSREVEGLGMYDYCERLKRMGMYSIRGRLLRQDLVKIWKAFNAEVEFGLSSIFEVAADVGTRGHSLKLSVPLCRSEARRRSFAARCVGQWNSLRKETVTASSLSSFKSRLDFELGDVLFAVS